MIQRHRHIISSVLFLYGYAVLLGQSPAPSYILQTNETGASKTYVVRDYVSMKPGFSYTAASDKNFNARIDESLLFPAQYQTEYQLPDPYSDPDTSFPVGSIEGSASVTPSGGGIYQIPIQLPAGINGIQPAVSIVYNSQSGNGLLGYGWNLSAFSVISRTGKTYYHDGSATAPDLSTGDNLMLDGQRLMLASGSNLTANAKYGTEIDTYSEITYKTIGNYLCFEMKTPDGSVMEYGSTADSFIEAQGSSTPVYWLLSKVTDKNGNYITYSYQENNSTGEFYLKSIHYTGNTAAGVSPACKVEFFYETRSDVQKSYIAGKRLTSSVILNKIKTSISGVTDRLYILNYFYDDFCSKLTEITEYSGENVRYNSTKIDWGDYYGEYSRYGMEDIAFLSDVREGIYPIFADFDGDGKTDMLAYPNKSSYTSSDVATLYLAYSYYGMVSFSKKCTVPLIENFKGFLIGDMDGEGRNDLIRITLAPNGTYRYNYYMWDGTKLTYNYKGFNTDSGDGLAGDFNGDGKFEILIKSNQKVYNGEGSVIATGGIDSWGIDYIPHCYPNNLYLTDFNGNGKTDILVMNGSSCWVYELNGSSFSKLTSFSTTLLKNSYFTYPGDFNGDGKTDILAQYAYDLSNVFILFSNGSSFEKQTISLPELQSKPFVGDCNRDGKSEIAFLKARSSGNIMDPQLGIYNGSGFTLSSNTSTWIDRTKIRENGASSNMCLADFDGDGRSELCLAAYSDASIISYLTDKQNLQVKNIIDGMGRTTSYEYAIVSDDATYNETASSPPGFPIANNKIPLSIVKNLTQWAGSYYSSAYYSYKDLRMHRQGKGFLCFGEITATDYNKSQKTVTKYGYNSSYYFPYITEQAVSTTSGNLISTVTNTNTYVYVGNKRVFPYVSSQVSVNALTGVSQTVNSSNMEYGNPKTVVKSYNDGNSETMTRTFMNITSGDKRILGLPQTMQTVKAKSGQSWTEKLSVEYNGQYLPSKKTTYTKDGTKQTGEENFTYDAVGNTLTSGVKTYNAGTVLTTTYVYSADKRFLVRKTDPLGLFTEYGYNPSKGRLISVKDHWGNAVHYEYDSFGRQIKQTNPDGTTSTSVLAWESNPYDAQYSVTQTATGKPVTKTLYDGVGREIRSILTRFDGSEMKTDKVYDNKGRLQKTSLPFKGSSAALWNTYEYDAYHRPVKLTYASGKTDTWTYNGNSVTTVKDGISTAKTYNAKGELLSSSDPGGAITYTLRPDGQPSTIMTAGVATTFSYDDYGRQVEINDPSAGLQTFAYNSAGYLSTQVDANGEQTNMTYDNYGRITQKSCPEFATTYGYDSHGQLTSETTNNGTSIIYTYDNLRRISSARENTPDGKWLQKSYSYVQGNIQSVAYAAQSGSIVTENYYYANGHPTEIKLNEQTSIWKLNTENDMGMPTKATTGSVIRNYGYNTYGLPTFRKAEAQGSLFLEYAYSFNEQTGNLYYRDNNIYGTMEDFGYGTMNRLTGIYCWNNYDHIDYTVSYDVKGNITNHSQVGAFGYNYPGKPYAVTDVDLYGNDIPQCDQTVTYTSFMRPATISENGYAAQFTYNGSGGRVRMRITDLGSQSVQFTRYYVGGQYETDVTPTTTTERLYLDGDAYSSPSVLIKNGAGNWNIYYICRDYLGSITHVTDASGTVVQEMEYDAWGRLRNPATQVIYAPGSEPALFLGRGYTGHEHLPWFGLINMNARLYDPALGRFLSPDPYVQAPDFTQNFNRYSYALNNPFKYIDPNGNNPLVIIGLVLLGGYLGGVATNHGELNPGGWDWKDPGTYFGIGFGMFAGYVGGYWLFHPGALNIAFGLSVNSQWGSLAVGVSGLTTTGVSSDFNFHWSTSAGGGGYVPLKEQKPAEITVNEPVGNSRFFQGNYYEASQLLSYISREGGVERIMYETDFGYYYEPANGYVFADFSKSKVSQTNNTYWGVRENGTPIYYVQSTINGTYPFNIKQRGNNLYLDLGLANRYRVYGVYHTHPGNTMLSLDDAFQNMKGIRVKAIGWDGYSRGSYFDNNTYYINELIVKP